VQEQLILAVVVAAVEPHVQVFQTIRVVLAVQG
jgi:hypothetical protein